LQIANAKSPQQQQISTTATICVDPPSFPCQSICPAVENIVAAAVIGPL